MASVMKGLAALAAALVLAAPAASARAADEGKNLKVGFVYVSPVGDDGWSYAHDQ